MMLAALADLYQGREILAYRPQRGIVPLGAPAGTRGALARLLGAGAPAREAERRAILGELRAWRDPGGA